MALTNRTDASPLIPEEVSNAMLTELNAKSFALNNFTNLPVSRSQTRFPVLSALPSAHWVNGDTGQKQTTKLTWDNKYLNIEELATIVPIPEAVIDDSEMPIWDLAMPLCVNAAARLIDNTIAFGTSAPDSFPDDLVTAATAASNDVEVGTSTADEGGIVGDHSAMLDKLEADGYSTGAGIAHQSLRGLARQARNANGDRFGEVSVGSDSVAFDYVNYSFPEIQDLWPVASGDPVAIAFVPNQFVVGVRQDITWKFLDQAVIQGSDGEIMYNLAQQDMVAMRMVMRVGWQVANPINYTEATEADRYPAAILTRA